MIRVAISEAMPAHNEPKMTKPALTESELVKTFCVAIPSAAANDAAVVPRVGKSAFAGTSSSPSTTCGREADNAAWTNLFTPRLIKTSTARIVLAEFPVITIAIAIMVITRTKLARIKIIRRDQRSIKTPTKGATSE